MNAQLIIHKKDDTMWELWNEGNLIAIIYEDYLGDLFSRFYDSKGEGQLPKVIDIEIKIRGE